eukprot:CAMPEP_0176466384 /NCGR_PEP_ID=MMETSP0127-20121128/37859_1 /TAXON_ID=938130 /ORGANISM="Platyophrya macrostoma, Strain WH" /LENGTH=319 /DNA_ID=CAMNT_0017859539 /DNA_START=60 /DNA_END=1019 /DNA_ORIENTATION=+
MSLVSVISRNFGRKYRGAFAGVVDNNVEKQPKYVHTTNYNLEQFPEYTKKLKSVVDAEKKEEEIQKKIESGQMQKPVPRRKRRIYDRPRFDTNIQNYDAWLNFDRQLPKYLRDSLIVRKVNLAPAKVAFAFGTGSLPLRNDKVATREYDFEDNNFDTFLLYDHKQTTDYWGDNEEGYDYENQGHLHPNKRQRKYPTEEEFWKSEEEYPFRFNHSPHADWMKFKTWLLDRVNNPKRNVSYEQYLTEKYGPLETYDNYDKTYENLKSSEFAVLKYSRGDFLKKGEKADEKDPYMKPLVPPKKLTDEFLIDPSHDQEQEAAK